jgi:hypothetical protein
MKELCPVCQQYKLKRKGQWIRKCTKCAYEFIKYFEPDGLGGRLETGYLSILDYEILPNGQKARRSTKMLCKGTFEYCVKIFKLKAFI